MKISPLVDIPEAIPILAHWFHEEWHEFDGRSISDIETQLAENLTAESIPITFVVHHNDAILGSVSLDISDLPPFDYLSPWLAALYVHPSVRGRGVGGELIRHLLRFASTREISPLYLWTFGPTSLYERQGWTMFGSTIYRSKAIKVMHFRQVQNA